MSEPEAVHRDVVARRDLRHPGFAPVENALVLAGIALAAILLAIHSRTYLFLTDDSFISFRYARNLSHGYGLVFNPGGERVEGYSNLLWVLILAGFNLLGLAPETMALVLSLAATAALFGLVVWFVWARAGPGRAWIALLPAFFLATTRSFAVWASSGLETRLFELLLVAGIIRLVGEVEDRDSPGKRRLVLAPWLFGLAALTRPDGALVGGCAFLATVAYLLWRSGRVSRDDVIAWWPLAALIVAQSIFRIVYYGAWLPNTYYAKVGAKAAWQRGLGYVNAFALEYSAYLWLPGLVAAILWHRWRNTLFVPLLFAAAVLPHALYVIAIGGDHFEYRPLDFYLPLIFVLLADGACYWATSRAGASIMAIYTAVVITGLAWLPIKSHLQYPRHYMAGFPGREAGLQEAGRFLSPEGDPLFDLPGLRIIAREHRRLVRDLTAHLAGVRQEEHRMFLDRVDNLARKLNGLLARGLLPADTYVAMDCVGIVPYRTNLRTLDRLGLTDATVAHSGIQMDLVAHAKHATIEYARQRGVDLWAADPVFLVCPAGSDGLEEGIREALGGSTGSYAADVGSGDFVFCQLPQGLVVTRRRLPHLSIRPLADSSIVASYVDHFLPTLITGMREGYVDTSRVRRFGEICILGHCPSAAAWVYETASETWPNDWQFCWMLAISRNMAGDAVDATASLDRAVTILREEGNAAAATGLIATFQSLRKGGRSP